MTLWGQSEMVEWLKRFFMRTAAAVIVPEPTTREHMRISHMALSEAHGSYGEALNPWRVPAAPQWLPAGALAMDKAPGVGSMYDWAQQGAFSEGLAFLGYPYLAELSQRGEYRRMVEIIAAQATRKWIKITGEDKERIGKIHDAMKRFGIQARIREALEHDGFFGRSQIFVDLGHRPNDTELSKPLIRTVAKVGVGSIKNFKVIEPFWCYPGAYDSTNPLAPDFYRPRYWQVMSSQVHASRLLQFVSREVPDILKPAYLFGGLALTQMAKPYVDNWLRTRQSVSDLVHSFSTMVLATDMSQVLSNGRADDVVKRALMFNQMRDNRGLMMVNKDSEELSNVTTPLSGVHDLQSQAQEQMSSITGIPLVIFLGVTPSGLNASSDGEIQTFYDNIASFQERVMRGPLENILELIQLDLDGVVDPGIQFEFEPLRETDESEEAANRKSDGDLDCSYVDRGIVSPEEVRERISNDENNPYHGVDLSSAPPSLEEDDDEDDDGMASDEWNEGDHPRGEHGRFGSGGSVTVRNFADAKAVREHFEAEHKAASAVLKAVPGVGSGQFGKTPDEVRAKPEYQIAKARADHAFEQLRKINGLISKHFKKEDRADYEAERDARRAAKLATLSE